MQLVRDPSRADLIVDASNVCSREVLGGDTVSIARLNCAVRVFEQWSGMADARVFVVADNSLLPRLDSKDDRRTLRSWAQEGLIEMLPGADERILELVDLTGMPALTWDRFQGHRDVFPWLQGDAMHFLLVRETGDGLSIGLRDMGVVPARRVSEHAEIDALKASRLLDSHGRPDASVLERWWICPEPGCTLFSADRRHGQPIPYRQDGRLLCSLHRLQLTDAGVRAMQVQVKVLVDGRVRDRFLLEQGEPPSTIGRGRDVAVDLTPLLDPQLTDLVSRHHAEVQVRNGDLWVRDLSSTNGTGVRTGPGEQVVDLPSETYVLTKVTDQILLAGIVVLEVSGRRYPFAAGQTPAARPAPSPAETRHV